MRKTIRVNIEDDGLLFHTIWKKRKIDRPKVMAICDVSGSVAQVSRFLLMFLDSLHDVIPNVRSFAFSGQTREVTDLFEREEVERAIAETLDRFGGSTDYGEAFETFELLVLNEIDRKTTVPTWVTPATTTPSRARTSCEKSTIAREGRSSSIPSRARPGTPATASCAPTRSLCGQGDRLRLAEDLERVVSDLLRTAV